MYFDGFVAPIKAGRKAEYETLCREMRKVFLEHGALHIVEGFGDGEVPEGKVTDLWRAVAADRPGGETLVFSWIVWESKEARDRGWEKCVADERMSPPPGEDAPFDTKRMIYGGFDVMYDSNKG